MDHLRKVRPWLWFWIAAVLTMASCSSWGATNEIPIGSIVPPTTVQCDAQHDGNGSHGNCTASAQPACDDWGNGSSASVFDGVYRCLIPNVTVSPIVAAITCPAGSGVTPGKELLSNTYFASGYSFPVTCTTTQVTYCSGSNVWDGTACVPPTSCANGTTATGTFFLGHDTNRDGSIDSGSAFWNATTTPTVCSGGCKFQPSKVNSVFSYADAPTKIYGTYTLVGIAESCTGGETQTDNPNASSPCPAGQGLAEINGISRCLPSDPNQQPPKPNAPAKTTTETNTTTNPDNSTTTTETSCTGDSCTTTTTTCNPQKTVCSTVKETKGTEPGKGTQGQSDQAQFCRDNPESPMCKQGQWGGSCGSFTCQGDAIQCAQAQAAWKLACEIEKESDQKTLGQQLWDDADPKKSSFPNPSSPPSVGIGSLSTSGPASSSASCPANRQFTVFGTTVPISYAPMCELLGWLGNLIMVVASVLAGRIVMKGA